MNSKCLPQQIYFTLYLSVLVALGTLHGFVFFVDKLGDLTKSSPELSKKPVA